MYTGHRGTATWQPQSVKHSLWNPLLSPHEDELTVQFSVIKRFELFFQLFNLKMWDKKLPVSSLPKNAFLVESSTLLHSVAQTHHEWAPRQLWGATDTYFKRSIPLLPYLTLLYCLVLFHHPLYTLVATPTRVTFGTYLRQAATSVTSDAGPHAFKLYIYRNLHVRRGNLSISIENHCRT